MKAEAPPTDEGRGVLMVPSVASISSVALSGWAAESVMVEKIRKSDWLIKIAATTSSYI
jgi:hypothetical protein